MAPILSTISKSSLLNGTIMSRSLEHQPLQFYNIPIDCRINILSYLSPTDLYANFAHCSRACHGDSLSSKLPQTKWGEFHVGNDIDIYNTANDDDMLQIRKEINMEMLLQRIVHPSFRTAWQAPRCHMKICGHEQKSAIVVSARIDDLSFEEMQEIVSEVSFEDVTSLNMSVSDRRIKQEILNNRVLPRCLPWLLSSILPGLVELDFSNLHGGPMNEGDYISELSLFNSSNCPNMRKIRWDNRVGGCYFLRGKDMRSLDHLNELYIDNILCGWRFDKLFAPLMDQFFREASTIQRFLFFACNKSLERVSVRGGRYLTMGTLIKKEFPQWALIRFVRRTTTLKWFRSDLTEANIRLLSSERPEISFCN